MNGRCTEGVAGVLSGRCEEGAGVRDEWEVRGGCGGGC